MRTAVIALLSCTLGACAAVDTHPPANVQMLPVVSYPDRPSVPDYVYLLPADRDIEVQVIADGSALVEGISRTVGARLRKDVYLYKGWASNDGKTWKPSRELLQVKVDISLPSHERPGPGKIRLNVERGSDQAGDPQSRQAAP